MFPLEPVLAGLDGATRGQPAPRGRPRSRPGRSGENRPESSSAETHRNRRGQLLIPRSKVRILHGPCPQRLYQNRRDASAPAAAAVGVRGLRRPGDRHPGRRVLRRVQPCEGRGQLRRRWAARAGGLSVVEGAEFRVRMGFHIGEPSAGGEGYHGPGVHRGARICARADDSAARAKRLTGRGWPRPNAPNAPIRVRRAHACMACPPRRPAELEISRLAGCSNLHGPFFARRFSSAPAEACSVRADRVDRRRVATENEWRRVRLRPPPAAMDAAPRSAHAPTWSRRRRARGPGSCNRRRPRARVDGDGSERRPSRRLGVHRVPPLRSPNVTAARYRQPLSG